jgi:hypothetical protein
MSERLTELLESWVNGNRSDVADELSRGPRGDMTDFLVALVRTVGPADGYAFSRMVRNRDT